MFDSVNVGIIATDLEPRLIEVNDAALKMFGYTREEIIGQDGLNFLAEEDRKNITEDMRKIFKDLHNVNLRYNITTKKGGISTVEISATLLHNSNGDPTGFMAILRDIGH